MFDKNGSLASRNAAGAIERAVKTGLCLLAVLSSLYAQTGAPVRGPAVIAVLDPTGDGSVSDATMRSIGDKIAGEISLNKKFTVYDRENMAFVLEQLSPKPPSPCPDVQCYSDLGNQIGADQIVAGSVMVKGGKLRIALERIDAGKKRKIRGVNRVLSAKKEDFIATIMPELVKELMSGDAQKPQTTTSNNNGTLGNWAIGAGATAAVAAGVAAIVLSKKTNQAGSESQFLLEPPMHTP